MSTTKKNIRFNRERFEQGANFYSGKGISPQQSQLRVCIPLAANTGNYKVNIKEGVSVPHVIEHLLRRNDLFVARAIGLALMVEPTADKGKAPLYSYPVLAGLTLPDGYKGLTDTSAYALYNGILTMKTNGTTNFSSFPLNRFLNVPTQQPIGIWDADAKEVISAGIVPQFNLEDLLEELPEVIVFAGTKEQPITLEFPACTIAGEALTQAYAVLIVEGWLYEGGTTEDCHASNNPYDKCF